MMDRFDHLVRYDITATCLAPLRTGNSEGDTEEVLRLADGTAILQGTSIAGALRAETEKRWGKDAAKELFGSEESMGQLIISDGEFEESAQQYLRPRLRINDTTCCADNGGKFDVAHIEADTKFFFSVIWKGVTENRETIEHIETLFSAINAGIVLLGAQKSNGFGKVSLSVLKRSYDMKKESDRRAWLENQKLTELLILKTCMTADVVFEVTGYVEDLLIKASATERKGDGGKEVAVNICENGKAILPGSSFKGAVRAQAERIARYLVLPDTFTEELFGRGSKDGDNGKYGKVFFDDVALECCERTITRIHIDRFTGGVMSGKLFTEVPISADVCLKIHLINEPAKCALLLLALRDLGLGLYALGSGSSIGRGFVDVDRITAFLPNGETAELIFDTEKKVHVVDENGIISDWLDSLEVLKNGD